MSCFNIEAVTTALVSVLIGCKISLLTDCLNPGEGGEIVTNYSKPIPGDQIARQASQVSRTVAGITLTDVLLIVAGFIVLDVFFTLLLVAFSSSAGKRSSQDGLFSWGLPSFSGLYNNVSEMYNR